MKHYCNLCDEVRIRTDNKLGSDNEDDDGIVKTTFVSEPTWREEEFLDCLSDLYTFLTT